jgi:hypothetical protein
VTDWIQLLGGGLLLYFGAEWFVGGASSLAVALRVPQLVVGLTVVAYGTSAPEVIVGVQAASAGHGDVALGNVIGSNIQPEGDAERTEQQVCCNTNQRGRDQRAAERERSDRYPLDGARAGGKRLRSNNDDLSKTTGVSEGDRGGAGTLPRRGSLAVRTTRKPRAGRHDIDVLVNGEVIRAGSSRRFELGASGKKQSVQ